MLQVDSLAFDYSDKPLLKEVHCSLAPGQLLHLRGANGSGKTTLLRILAGLLQPVKGTVLWKGQPIQNDLSSFQRQLCYVGHKKGLSAELSVQENCMFDSHWQRKTQSMPDLLERFDLAGMADIRCSQLSEGQKRRVALLRIVMTDAPLWLLDEPLVALDTSSVTTLATCLREHLAGKGLIVMTSHQRLPGSIQGYAEYFL